MPFSNGVSVDDVGQAADCQADTGRERMQDTESTKQASMCCRTCNRGSRLAAFAGADVPIQHSSVLKWSLREVPSLHFRQQVTAPTLKVGVIEAACGHTTRATHSTTKAHSGV